MTDGSHFHQHGARETNRMIMSARLLPSGPQFLIFCHIVGLCHPVQIPGTNWGYLLSELCYSASNLIGLSCLIMQNSFSSTANTFIVLTVETLFERPNSLLILKEISYLWALVTSKTKVHTMSHSKHSNTKPWNSIACIYLMLFQNSGW